MAGSLSPRAVYVLTKIAVFAVAAALTWPLAKFIGPKAWWGLGVFGLILAVLTIVVVYAFGRSQAAGVEHLAPFDWLPPGVTLTNNRGVHAQKAGEYGLMALLMCTRPMAKAQ